ncbi:MAG: leucyl aminopeptidase [Nitrospirota bacterium]
MEIKIKRGSVLSGKSDAALFMVFEDEKLSGSLAEMDVTQGGIISQSVASGEFTGKRDETILFHCAPKTGPARIILAGLGRREKFTPDNLMRAAGAAASLARKSGLKEISAHSALPEGVSGQEFASLLSQGALMALYNFDRFKQSESKKKELKSLTIFAVDRTMESALKKGTAEGRIIADSVNFAKNMINAPANEMTPSVMAAQAKKAAKDAGFKIKVLEADECGKLGMGAFLGVASGSKQPPKFIVMEYSGGKKSEPPFTIIGKGITFDSGGISIKPSEGMEKMKYDMAGAGAVIAAIRCAAALKMPVNLVAIAPCSENMPGGAALKPGDMVRAINGKTIEIISTDAEGRLVLADALCYAARYKPKAVIDIATLTGACVIALGDSAIGLMGNDRGLINEVRDAGEAANERAWELPMWDEYLDAMKGDVTDLRNVGGRKAATVTAGKFLQEFVDYPWVHLDIAGTAWEEKGKPYCPKGATAIGVRLIIEFLKKKSA